ncbi:serine protease [Linnemannia exigua]|uniref:Serine protease n=1 Tax=Linnemannia exigua TaxID=604196 RepID=A0AAD4DD83_9FUNG|nr:serine protease [Linnemannia exigua]
MIPLTTTIVLLQLLLVSSTTIKAATTASPFNLPHLSDSLAPLLSINKKAVPDSYLVVFKEGGIRARDFSAPAQVLQTRRTASSSFSSSSSSSIQVTFGARGVGRASSSVWDDIADGIKHVYDIGSFQGIAGHFQPDALHEIHKHPAVSYVEHNSMGRLAEIKTQEHAPWGIARISRRDCCQSARVRTRNLAVDTMSPCLLSTQESTCNTKSLKVAPSGG